MHNKELFQKILSALPRNSCCTNAVMQWIAMLGCCWWLAVLQLQPHGSIPWAEGSSCSPGLGLQTPTSNTPLVLSPGLISINYDSQTRGKPCKVNSQSSQSSTQGQCPVQETSAWTGGLLHTKASQGARVWTALSSPKPASYSRFMPGLAQYFAHPTAYPVAFCSWSSPAPSPSLLRRWGIRNHKSLLLTSTEHCH